MSIRPDKSWWTQIKIDIEGPRHTKNQYNHIHAITKVELGYNDHGYNEITVITISLISHDCNKSDENHVSYHI